MSDALRQDQNQRSMGQLLMDQIAAIDFQAKQKIHDLDVAERNEPGINDQLLAVQRAKYYDLQRQNVLDQAQKAKNVLIGLRQPGQY